MADVEADVEVRFVDPDRVAEVKGNAVQLLPVARKEVEALADCVFDSGRRAPPGTPDPASKTYTVATSSGASARSA